MAIAQDKGATSQAGLGAELIVIASVIIGGASILGGRGRVIGSCLGALVIVLIDKVLREGVPITRTMIVNGVEVKVNAVSSLPVGAVPVFLGLLLLVAVLIEPYVVRRRVVAPWAWLRGRPPPPAVEIGGVALEGAQTKGSMASDKALTASGFGRFLARRDALAIILTVVLWLVGLYLRPDYWWHLPNIFAILLNYTELALLTVGLTYVIACGDIDLSVGAVLAFAGSTAAYFLKVLGADPLTAVAMAMLAGTFAGALNALITVGFGLPAFIATLGMFYTARGLAAWLVAGQQLTGWTENFNLLGRKVGDILSYLDLPPLPASCARSPTPSASRPCGWPSSRGLRPSCSATRPSARRCTRPRAISAPPPTPASTQPRARGRAHAVGLVRDDGRHHQRRVLPQLQPGRRAVSRARRDRLGDHRRRLDLRRLRDDHRVARGAAVITLVRALLQLNIITASGRSIVLPQHWVNAFIGVILIVAVLIDIWIRQANVLGRLRDVLARRRRTHWEAAHSWTLEHAARPSSRCATSPRHSVRSRRWPTSISSSTPARSSASSATIRPASRR